MSYNGIVSPRMAYYQARQNFPDIDEELARSRERRRANDEQTARDAEEFVQQFITPKPAPAPAAQPAPQQDNGINWGLALGSALGKVGGAVVDRLTQDKPEPPLLRRPLYLR